MLQAFAQVIAETPQDDLTLVIAGGKGWGGEDYMSTVDALKLHDHVRFAGFVEDDHLPELYRGALLFVYPSLYEGFGLPVLEAMACGTPVITSNRASLPEVAGDAALLVDPTQPEALAAAMTSILNDGELRQDIACQRACQGPHLHLGCRSSADCGDLPRRWRGIKGACIACVLVSMAK